MMNDEWEEINEYYRKNPPQIVLDDLGIYFPVHVPLPAKYVNCPCKCGIIHKWEEPHTFRVECIPLFEGIPPKPLKKCNKCDEVLTLELLKD